MKITTRVFAAIFALITPLILKLLLKETSEFNILIGILGLWLITFSLIIFDKKILKNKEDKALVKFKKITIKEAIISLVLGLVLSLLVPVFTFIVSTLIPLSNDDINTITNLNILVIIFSIFTAAVAEEIIYRGFVYEILLQIKVNKYFAVFISLIGFTLIHINNWSINHILGVVIPLGLILNIIYIKKRNLIFNIIIHFIINSPLILFAILS